MAAEEAEPRQRVPQAPGRAAETPPLLLRVIFGAISRMLQRLGARRFGLADLIGLCIAVSQPARLRATAQRHRRADPSLSYAASMGRARRSFVEYARTNLDFLWAHDLDHATARLLSDVHDIQRVFDARDRYGAGILVLAHHGSWDTAATIALAYGVPLATVMRPFGAGTINQLAVWSREERGLEVHLVNRRAAHGLVDAIHRGRFPAILIDIPEAGRTAEAHFRGGPVRMSTGPAWLARRTGVPIIPVVCYRAAHVQGGGYAVHVDEPLLPESGEDDAAVTQRVAARLDALIRLAPAQWYPFNPVYTDE